MDKNILDLLSSFCSDSFCDFYSKDNLQGFKINKNTLKSKRFLGVIVPDDFLSLSDNFLPGLRAELKSIYSKEFDFETGVYLIYKK